MPSGRARTAGSLPRGVRGVRGGGRAGGSVVPARARAAERRPSSPCCATGVLKWRFVSTDDSMVPLTINCWPSVSGDLTYVNTEYELTDFGQGFSLTDASLPAPAFRTFKVGVPGAMPGGYSG